MTRLLLLSNSTIHGEGFLDWAEEAIRDYMGERRRITFVPFALDDLDAYARTAKERLGKMGYTVASAHEGDPREQVRKGDAIFVGGGNTFRLLTRLYEAGLIEEIRRAVSGGTSYIGSSAGTNVATPTIKTTNDMPIVYPPTFDALNLVRFQINPHYIDADPSSKHMGETREQRIREFHEMNDAPVLGMREGAYLRIEEGAITLGGRKGARLFRKGVEPTEHQPGTRLTELE
ncbi:MAG TPA: dipeptidase PepE [Thermoanaerobaculia bacterium]|nr:dipeptidase PepE [Thermoanaerobaculia bacterium]